MNMNQAIWEKGDFTQIASTMRTSGERLVADLGIRPDTRVLDLGCGDGTTAIPAARIGADVLGIDIARNLVEAGNKRAAEEHLANIRFQQGDASNLDGIEDQAFDAVISIFGAMLAPQPFKVAAEMVRVTKHGGRIIMGNWIPNDPTRVAQILKTSATYAPPPPQGCTSPMTWGVQSNVVERFVAAGIPAEQVLCKLDTYVFESPKSPAAWVDDFQQYYGPTMNAFYAAHKSGRAEELREELKALFVAQNAGGIEGPTTIPATYLRVSISV